jgi:hypothetical protein
MTISTFQIIGLALRLVSKRDQIANIWGQIAPLVREITSDPAVKSLMQQVAPPQPQQQADSGFSVQWLQESLNTLGQGPLDVTGDYDEETKARVRDYQSAHPPLAVDGWAGINTQASIHDELAKHK